MRTKTSTILKAARKHLPTHGRQGICIAIHNATAGSREDRIRVCKMISKRIYPFNYASNWLAWKIVTGTKNLDPRRLTIEESIAMHRWLEKQEQQSIQMWRHQWLNQMIAEFKKKGD